MRNKFSAVFIAFAFVLNGIAFAADKPDDSNKQINQLAAFLPASDGVLTINITRLLNEAMPQVLVNKPQMLDGINGKIDAIREKTGLDLRQFEQVAVGVATKQISAKEIDLEPAVLLRGKYDAGALVTLAKIASKGKYREEKSGDKTIYIFAPKEIIEQNKPATKDGKGGDAIDRIINRLSKEVAVASFDNKTLAVGTLARVRETLTGKSRIAADVLSLANRQPNAVVNFSMNLPNGLSQFVKLDNDEFGATLDSIRQLSGAADVADGNATLSLAAKTTKPEQAQSLQETLKGLQDLGKNLLGSAKSADKQTIGRIIGSVKIARNLTEVTIDLQVPQSDIDTLLGAK